MSVTFGCGAAVCWPGEGETGPFEECDPPAGNDQEGADSKGQGDTTVVGLLDVAGSSASNHLALWRMFKPS